MRHCFVIDDSDIVRKYTRLIFESLDFRVSEAASTEGAFERFKGDAPDFIIVDWRIPGCDPIQFIQLVRKAPLGKRPYILYLATENDHAEIKKAIGAGADDYMLKPFNKDIVEMKLHELKFAA